MKNSIFHAVLCVKFAFSFQQACNLISLTPKNYFDVNKSNEKLVNSKTIFKLGLILMRWEEEERSDFIHQQMPLLLDWRTDTVHPIRKTPIFLSQILAGHANFSHVYYSYHGWVFISVLNLFSFNFHLCSSRPIFLCWSENSSSCWHYLFHLKF